MKTQRVV